ncbi:MAG: SDR family NAD(P)-dependent oxidoreductase, partial [Anaerolineales bacterium]|nr:SDR family NAD(P)-dependent oxidoreductase [Anaerolineales bacterium]
MTNGQEKPQLSPIKQALLEIRRMRGQLDEIERAKTEPIAIVGIGLRYPGGADHPDKFWQLLRDGRDAIVDMPSGRWDVSGYYDPDPDAPGKMYVRQGGFLQEDVTQFDPTFFGISPREAQSMDPQQRLLMEVSWEAFENAGLHPDQLMGSRTGVFIGIGGSPDYLSSLLLNVNRIDAYAGPGATYSAAAGRLSYFYGLKGPAMSVDTACSSSLVTTHLATQSLRSGECDMALVAGVTLHLQPHSFINQCKLRMTSPDGRSKAFDASGDGVGRGEGCGIVILKRLSDAVAAGDNVLALIRGSAVNQDGRTSGLTAPNGPSQQDVIRRALANAGVAPHEVSYLEAHGTGTALGDPIEIQAAASVYGQGRPADRPLLIGSVKTNIGHLEEGAGVASLIKVTLALRHGVIPPSLNYDNPNPYIPWDQLPVQVNTALRPFPEVDGRRLVGISSFGWSGTNAHIVVEAAPPVAPQPVENDRPQHLLRLSAANDGALRALAARYQTFLAQNPAVSLADVAFTANTRRADFSHRLGVVAANAAEAAEKLAAFGEDRLLPGLVSGQMRGFDRPDVAFLFTGQGSQYIGMGRQLYDTEPVFRAALDRCDELLRPYLDHPLLSLLYPADGQSPIDETAYTQPALFALEYALAQLWQSWGIEPDIVTGHSVGEYVAACIAGVFSLEDGLRLIAERGRLMQTLPTGGVMFNIFATEARVLQALAPYEGEVSIAALNGPEIVVISGAKTAVQQIVADLRADEIRAWPLAVSHALHTAGMDDVLDEFEKVAATIRYAPPRKKLVSMVTGKLITGAEIANAAYWRRHMRDTVRFSDAIVSLHELGHTLFLEIGPDPKLSTMGQLCIPEGAGTWVPSLRQNRDEWQQMLESVGLLYTAGVKVDWAVVDRERAALRRRLMLPTYPFQRQRYWLESAADAADKPGRALLPAGQSPVLSLLDQGDTEQLIAELKEAEQLSDDDVALAPRLLDALIRRHQQQVAAASIQAWLHEIRWEPRALDPAADDLLPAAPGLWLLFADPDGVAEAAAARLAALEKRCVLVTPGAAFAQLAADRWQIDPAAEADYGRLLQAVLAEETRPFEGVVYLWSLAQPADEPLPAQVALGVRGALHLVQALQQPAIAARPPRLWLATRGAQPVGKAGVTAVAQAAQWGLGNVVGVEHPDLRPVQIDLDPEADAAANAGFLFAEIHAQAHENGAAVRRGARYVARLAPAPTPTAEPAPLPVQADAAYLITGGMGGLGLRVARWLVAQGARHLLLMGRRAPSDKAQAVIDELTAAGAQVVVGRGDVADADQLARVLAQIEAEMPPLRGVMHAAGGLDDGVLLQQTWPRFEKVLAPKVAGTWHLHTQTQEMPLDFFVLFSSIAATLGSPGQANYAAANSFQDAFAHFRRAQGLPAQSINWGGWDNVGMAATLGSQSNQRWASIGVGLIPPEQGMAALAHIMRQDVAQRVVLPVNWARFMGQFPPGLAPRFLETLAAQVRRDADAAPADEQPAVLQALAAAAPHARRELLMGLVREQAAAVLALDPTFVVDPATPLRDLGMDSLMAVQLRNAISGRLGRPLPATLLFNYPTVGELTDYLSRELLPELAAAAAETAAPAAPPRASAAAEPIAIVGMSARFPGAPSLDDFWALLRDGVDAIAEVPPERWNVNHYFDPEPGAPGKMYTRWGGFLREVDQFDPQFFGISPREAVTLDPQQRLLLEAAWQALEHAGMAPSRLQGTQTGVFVGIGNYDYAQLQLKQGDPKRVGTYTGSGNALSMAAGRLSYVLGLQGPSMAVDTACSSSLVALHLACQSLHDGESDVALAGGVNLILAPEPTVALSQAHMMANDGRCKTFDAAANGFVRSEGCGIVVLKRLSDALAAGDNVLAVVQGTAINQDGRSQGLTAPNGLAQEAVIRAALARAGVAPGDVQYIEAHGTGTALGDPIEVGALGAVYGAARAADNRLLLGSVKTNIGHSENAAGIAGLIKVVLSLQNEQIPPHLHFRQPNPFIPWDELPVEVVAGGRPWPAGERPRIAGLSSFGFSGTNAHAIIAEAPRVVVPEPDEVPDGYLEEGAAAERPQHLLALSARDAAALRALAERYVAFLGQDAPALAEVCHTANAGRAHFAHRLAVQAADTAELHGRLAAFLAGEAPAGVAAGSADAAGPRKVAFLFTGQGAQYAGMGRQLYETQPTFRAALDECDRLLRPYLERPLLAVMFADDAADAGLIDETAYTQPALFAVEYALARLWQSWGVEPAVVMGHSVGEYVAATIAGVFSLADGLKLIAERGRLMQALPRDGAMAALFTAEARVQAALAPYAAEVSIAAVNGPANVVISGVETAVQAVIDALAAE